MALYGLLLTSISFSLPEKAFAQPSSLIVDTTTDETDDGECDTDCTLREALSLITDDGTITFDNSLNGQTIALTQGQLQITTPLTIDASSLSNGLTLDAQSNSRILNINNVTSGDGVIISGLTFIDGSANDGGGIRNYRSTLMVENSTLSNHSVTGYGGGIYTYQGKLTLENTTASGNSADDGGGIYAYEDKLTLLNSTVSNNTASGDGGGIYPVGETELTLRNSVISDSPSGGDCFEDPDAIITASYSLVEDGGCITSGSNGNLSGDPILGSLSDNGGPTLTHLPQTGSPLIDAGDDATCLDTDQRGEDRPDPVGSACDIGSVEVQQVPPPTELVVDTNADEADDGECDDDCTLREALALIADGGTITFDESVTGTINLTGVLPALSQDVEIQGPGADVLTVRRDSGGNYRIFDVLSGATVTISGLTISNGVTPGAGIRNGGELTVRASTITGNNVPNNSGGGIHNLAGGIMTLENSTVWGNTAGTSSGIYNAGTSTVKNSTVSGNTASSFGGGIGNTSGSMTVLNSTIIGNSASFAGGGIYNFNGGTLTIQNSVSANNEGGDCSQQSGTVTATSSLIEDGSCITPGEDDNLDGDPILGALADNGGPTLTHLPQTGSPLIDAGDDATCPDTDQRGEDRPYPVGSACDIGAVEVFQPPTELVVDTNADEADDGECDTDCTLREALALIADGGIITFDGSVTGTINLTGVLPGLSQDVEIQGPGADVLTIRRDSGGNYRVFDVLNGATVTISGLTISNGVTPGAGIRNGGELTVRASTITGNNVPNNSGGGIHNLAGGMMTLENSTVWGNTAGSGAGIYNRGTSTVKNSTVSGNTVKNFGGGITNTSGSMTVLNSTIIGNSASFAGGGIYNFNGGTLTIQNSVSANNKKGDCHLGGGTVTATSSLIEDGSCITPGEDDNLDGDPILGALADNGGPTITHLPLAGSPLFGAGDEATCPDSDQRGEDRPQPVDTVCDIGSVEVLQITPDADNILYVDQNVEGGDGSGRSWANAIAEIRDALAWANDVWDGADPPLQIWVADGLYLPTDDDTDRSATFRLGNNIEIYGGFDGGESSLAARNWETNLTILSGDIGGDDTTTDGVVTDTDDISGANSYHVVTGSVIDSTALLDGFTVTAGLANGTYPNNGGAGIYNLNSSPTLTNVTISGNSAGDGGGMYNNDSSSPTLTNVTISGNSAVYGGGMHNNDSSSPTLKNVTISGNSAGDVGGGILNLFLSSPTLTNTIVWGNSATDSGNEIFSESSIPLIYSLYRDQDGESDVAGDGGISATNSLTDDPIFTDPANGDFTLQNISPAINAGDPSTDLSLFPGGPDNPLDLAGNPRVFDGAPDPDIIDMGAYEFQGEPVTIPEQVVLSLPADEAVNVGLTPEFSWQPVDGADEYQLQVSENSDLSDSVIDESGLGETSFEPAGDLANATTYYWRVGASNAAGDGQWSEVFSFTTLPESSEVVILLSPANEAEDVPLKPLFEWNPADGADSYDLVVSPNPDFSDPVIDEQGIGDTEFQTGDDLDFSTTYYWHVRGVNSGGPGEWSETFSFTTLDQPEAADNRILLANTDSYTFTPADFGVTDNSFVVVIDDLPGGFNGDLELDGSDVTTGDEISVGDIDDGDLAYTPVEDEYGYGFDSFGFSIKDNVGNPSDESYTMSLDVAATSVELTAAEGTSGEGWRFLANPSDGDSYEDLLGPIWTKGIPGSDSPGATFANVFTLDQPNYQWEAPSGLTHATEPGRPFIVYVYGDDDNDGTPEGFPKTLTSGQNWLPLDGTFSYSGLGYDESEENPESHYLLANPHPVSLDFCEFTSTNIANSVDIWDPSANGGNGDYVNLSCGVDDVFIAPFQGFWVRTTDPNPVLEIPESAYLESAEEGYFKQPDDERSAKSPREVGADLGGGLTLTVQSEDNIFTNTARILFSEEASEGLDEWDAPKLSPAGLVERWLSFYSLDEEDKAYALQNLPTDFGEKISVPLDIQTTEPGRYTLNWNLPESHVLNGSYFLRDNRTGQVVELREGANYSFEIEPAQTSKVLKTLEVSGEERSAKSFGDFADLGEAAPRFELLIAQAGVDGFTELGAVPEEFELAQNYPNPFNPTTVISYQLPVNSEVRLEVFDMLGRNVATLVSGQVEAGRHTVNFDASGLSSGVYLYRLQARRSLGEGGAAGSTIMTKKLTVVK